MPDLASQIAQIKLNRDRAPERDPYFTGPGLPPRVRGHVTLHSTEAKPTITVTARNFELPRVVSERAGGWRSIARTNLRPIPGWDGYPELRIRIVLLLDAMLRGTGTVSQQVIDLRRLGYKVPELKRPPSLRAIGRLPEPYDQATTIRWVIASLQIEETNFNTDGIVTRARATIELSEYVDSRQEQRTSTRGGAVERAHTWRRSDTLHDLAEHYLGDRARWLDIRAANPRVQRWSQLPEGTTITIPAG